MTAAATETQVVAFLAKHPTVTYRAVPLAKEIGEQDIRKVRAALRALKAAGEVVSCTVRRGDEPADEEYRIVAAAGPNPEFSGARSRGARPPGWKPLSVGAPAGPINRPATPALITREIAPPKQPPKTAQEPRVAEVAMSAPAAAEAPVVAAPEPSVASAEVRHARGYDGRGRVPWRQQSILDVFAREQRDLTNGELEALLRQAEPNIGRLSVMNATFSMCVKGHLVKVRPRIVDRARGSAAWTYGTPAIAQRVRAGEIPPPAVAAVVEVEAEPLAEAAAPIPASPAADAQLPAIDRSEARNALEEFLRVNKGGWYSLDWMVRVSGGDIVATLESLAEWHRQGRVLISHADNVPVWSSARGSW